MKIAVDIYGVFADQVGAGRLRAATGMRYALLNPILEELVREGRIRMIVGTQGDLVSLISG